MTVITKHEHEFDFRGFRLKVIGDASGFVGFFDYKGRIFTALKEGKHPFNHRYSAKQAIKKIARTVSRFGSTPNAVIVSHNSPSSQDLGHFTFHDKAGTQSRSSVNVCVPPVPPPARNRSNRISRRSASLSNPVSCNDTVETDRRITLRTLQ